MESFASSDPLLWKLCLVLVIRSYFRLSEEKLESPGVLWPFGRIAGWGLRAPASSNYAKTLLSAHLSRKAAEPLTTEAFRSRTFWSDVFLYPSSLTVYAAGTLRAKYKLHSAPFSRHGNMSMQEWKDQNQADEGFPGTSSSDTYPYDHRSHYRARILNFVIYRHYPQALSSYYLTMSNSDP